MTTKYTYKEIWLIAYPILISLIMEQLIGMTDTAFLGRVGEIELGASAIAGVYYLAIFHDGVRIQHRSTNPDSPAKRRATIPHHRTDILSGGLFLLALAIVHLPFLYASLLIC